MWTSLDKILPQASRRWRLKEGLKQSQVFSDWDKEIGERLGQSFCNKSKPVKIKNQTLFIDCLNSTWASEFNLHQRKILNWLKTKIGSDKLNKIRFIS